MGASSHPLEHDDVNNNALYYELDLAGNVRRLMGPGGVDEGGYRYTAFGETYLTDADFTPPTGVAALPLRWKGTWLMYSANPGTASQVDLYDMRARWWCPQAGVFVQVDGFDHADPRSSLWSWWTQNPIRWSDPSGHDPRNPSEGNTSSNSYSSAADAALASAHDLGSLPFDTRNTEFASLVYFDEASNTFSYTSPFTSGGQHTVNANAISDAEQELCGGSQNVAAIVHNHPSTNGSELASVPPQLPNDANAASGFDTPVWAVGRNGTVSVALPTYPQTPLLLYSSVPVSVMTLQTIEIP